MSNKLDPFQTASEKQSNQDLRCLYENFFHIFVRTMVHPDISVKLIFFCFVTVLDTPDEIKMFKALQRIKKYY